MHMKAIYFIILSAIWLCTGTTTLAQSISPDVVASAGDYFLSASGSVSWTIGEPVTDTYTASSNILTKGFQQPVTIDLASVEENSGAGLFAAYPNPVED